MKIVRLLAHLTMLSALAAVSACGNKHDGTPQGAEESVQKAPSATGPLQVGDPLPPIKLDSVSTGKPIALTSEGGQLAFHDDTGAVSHPKAAIGFFCRY
jgi:hypothetical protein